MGSVQFKSVFLSFNLIKNFIPMKNRDKGVICMNNIDYVSILTLSIDWFLRIVQIITFIQAVDK